MDGGNGMTGHLSVSNVVQAEPVVSYPQFVSHVTAPDKPPPSYEESQQHVPIRNESSEVSQADKIAIYRHPLFPLLAMLFDKCELASCSQDGVNSQAFQNDIRTFLLHLGQDGKPLVSGNEETDNLMVKAILVLKIHLLEIEKVNELCKDFCQRYIACLKGKLQTENMLQGIYTSGIDDDFPSQLQTDPSLQLNQVQDISSLNFLSQNHLTTTTTTTSSLSNSDIKTYTEQALPTVTSTQMQTSLLNTHVQETSTSTIPAVSCTTTNPLMDPQFSSPLPGDSAPTQSLIPPFESVSNILPRKQSRRGVLPKQATNIMKAWLFQHIAHPYPSEEEKRVIASQTNLTLLQVNNWFINARRRILQPMLDASNPEVMAKTRKPKTIQSRSAQRFWPESLVQTIQGGTSTIQFPAGQTIHLIPATELTTGLATTIPVVATTNVLPAATELRIENVESRAPGNFGEVVHATIACPVSQSVSSSVARLQAASPANASLLTVVNSNDHHVLAAVSKDSSPHISLGTTPISLGTTPISLGTTPISLGTTPISLGTTPISLGTTPISLGTTPISLGTTPISLGTTPISLGTTPISLGTTPISLGTTPISLGTTPISPGTIPISLDPTEHHAQMNVDYVNKDLAPTS